VGALSWASVGTHQTVRRKRKLQPKIFNTDS
jgi:hypothetical protein